jgi:YegS/Rv2252/BmrU family lipid kinase
MPFMKIAKSQILFIINPNSGNKKPNYFIKKLKDNNIENYIISQTKADFDNLMQENIHKYKAFVFIGGDGTLNSALKHFENKSDKILAILPTGSGNGFARELNFTTDLKNLLKKFETGKTISIDRLCANNNDFVNVAGLGLDSYVAHKFEISNSRGFLNYIYTTFKAAFTYKRFYAEVEFKDRKIADKFFVISICNTRQFGNNAFISPKSNPSDGEFEVVMIKKLPFYKYPEMALRLFLRIIHKSKYVEIVRTSKPVKIKSNFNLYHLDGEALKFKEELEISLKSSDLRFIQG